MRSSKVADKFDERKMKLVPSFTSEGFPVRRLPQRTEVCVDAYLRLSRRLRVRRARRYMKRAVAFKLAPDSAWCSFWSTYLQPAPSGSGCRYLGSIALGRGKRRSVEKSNGKAFPLCLEIQQGQSGFPLFTPPRLALGECGRARKTPRLLNPEINRSVAKVPRRTVERKNL